MSTALDPDLLRAFIAVADLKSFTRAAVALNRTQSAVSMQIKRLEDRLGTALFHRTKSQVELTTAGEGLLDYAHRILALNDEAVGHVGEHKIEGMVRLGVMDDYGTLIIPPLLSGFAKIYPGIAVEMETGLTSGMVGRLGTDFDIVIAMHAEGSRTGTFLRHEKPVWATGLTQSAEKIDPLPLALYPDGCLFRKWATAALRDSKRPWRLAFVSHSLAGAEAMVTQGLAVTVVKTSTFSPRLRPLSGMPTLPMAEIRLHKVARAPRAITLLSDHLVAHLSRPN